MSRQTAAQIIGFGLYLEPEFDPATLTVSQLLGILGYHNIRYPTPYTKAKLIQVFNDEIKTRAARFKKERQRKEESIASEEGITDGITGKPLSSIKAKAPTPALTLGSRRSSRRLSAAPTEDDSSPVRPEPTKRRRSSAQPTAASSSRKLAQPPPHFTLVEESDAEDEQPVKKVTRTKKQASAATRRRVSYISGGEDSGWEDKNIFQSGAEDSSPMRPSPVKPRASRASVGPRKSRKSMSAPPPTADSPSPKVEGRIFDPVRQFDPLQAPPPLPFKPQLPSLPQSIKFESPSPIKPFTARYDFGRSPSTPPQVTFLPRKTESKEPESQPIEEEESDELPEPIELADGPDVEDEAADPDAAVFDADETESGVEDMMAVSRQLTEEVAVPPLPPGARSSAFATIFRILAWIAILGVAQKMYLFKQESASIGFCTRGTNTSQPLEAVLRQHALHDACNSRIGELAKLQSLVNSSVSATIPESCSLPPLIPFPRPGSCTACPAHADCSQFSVTCDSGFLLKPALPLSFIPVVPSTDSLTTVYAPQLIQGFFKSVSAVADGLPGFGSVAFPPRCVEDPNRKRHIGSLGKTIDLLLGEERGRRICQGGLDDSENQESYEAAAKWGIEIDKLREHCRKKLAKTRYKESFDEMFVEAIQQLVQWGGVFIGEDSDGHRYIAHKTPYLSLACEITVKSRQLWSAWRSTVQISILVILIALALTVRVIQRQKESRRVSGLVLVALDLLRNQELAHYTDPLTTPQPYVSSVQLRDVVLQDEHSVGVRRRLWAQVERIVESNANVRVNLEEMEGGDETRVWRWVGSATPRRPGRKEVE